MSIIVRTPRDLKPTPNILDGSGDLIASTLPRIDGHGLSQAEWQRLNNAENRARAEYSRSMPEADMEDVFRVGAAAAKDALRAVLRDRAPAPCCDPAELVPCSACVDLPAGIVAVGEVLPMAAAAVHPWDVESDPADWPDDTDNFFWATEPDDDDAPEDPEPRLTLAQLIDSEAARMRRMETDAGDLMAGALAELARVVRVVSATRPDQVEERLSILEADYVERAFAWEMPELELNSAGVPV